VSFDNLSGVNECGNDEGCLSGGWFVLRTWDERITFSLQLNSFQFVSKEKKKTELEMSEGGAESCAGTFFSSCVWLDFAFSVEDDVLLRIWNKIGNGFIVAIVTV
jgi:hypothetical protein